MKKLLLFLAIAGVCSSVASGDVVQVFYPTKDSGINKAYSPGNWDERWVNMGAITQCRPAKYRQHFLLMDFDWDAMNAFLAPFKGNPAYTFKYEFSMVAADDRLRDDAVKARLVIQTNDVDWIEGDGTTQFDLWNWTGGPAVTSQYAQTNPGGTIDPVTGDGIPADPPGVGPWPWGDFDGQRNRLWFYNVNPLTFGGTDERSYVELNDWWFDSLLAGQVLDMWGDVVETTPIVGIYTFDVLQLGKNGEAYTSDAGPDKSPLIRITVIPEPATMLLIVAGGVALMLRRKR